MIKRAEPSDLRALAGLALALWPDHREEELADELAGLLANGEAAFFLEEEGGEYLGFAQVQLRRDYVEGAHSSPVGYLEGIYVRPGSRRRGTARALLAACERWAADMGCAEFASDCPVDNADSLRFHLASGFQEAGRIICFTKQIKQ